MRVQLASLSGADEDGMRTRWTSDRSLASGVAGIVLAASLLGASGASAATSVSFVTPIPSPYPFPGSPSFGTTSGTYFHLTAAITIDGLGFWDAGSDGLASAYAIGLWEAVTFSESSLLVEAIMPAGEAAALVDGWRFADLPDLVIGPGYYTMGAVQLAAGLPADPGFIQSTPFGTFPGYIPEVDFGALTLALGNTPGELEPPYGYILDVGGGFGPTLFVVPEPRASILIALGLAGMASRRRWARD